MDKTHAQHIIEHFSKNNAWAQERNHFFESLCAAEFHWFFVQGLDAIQNDFFVPGISSLLNGTPVHRRKPTAELPKHLPGTNQHEPAMDTSNYQQPWQRAEVRGMIMRWWRISPKMMPLDHSGPDDGQR